MEGMEFVETERERERERGRGGERGREGGLWVRDYEK